MDIKLSHIRPLMTSGVLLIMLMFGVGISLYGSLLYPILVAVFVLIILSIVLDLSLFYYYTFLLVVVAWPAGRGNAIGTISFAGYQIFVVEILFLALFVVWLGVHIVKRQELSLGRGGVKNVVMLFFFGIGFLTMTGYLLGNDIANIASDLRPISYYLAFFPLRSRLLRKLKMEQVCKILIWGSVVYSLLMLSGYLPFGDFIRIYFDRGQYYAWRVMLSNDYQFIFVVPLIFVLIGKLDLRRSLPYILALVPILAKVMLTQWRGLWIAIAIVMLSWLVDIKRGPRRLGKAFLAFLLIFLVITTGFWVVVRFWNLQDCGFVHQLRVRLLSIFIISDESYSYRFTHLFHAIQQLRMDFLGMMIGSGMGSTFLLPSRAGAYKFNFVDNVLVSLFHKGGMLGLILFLFLFWMYKRETILIRKRSSYIIDPYTSAFIEVSAYAFYGFVFSLVASTALLTYPAIFFFVIVLALTEDTLACVQKSEVRNHHINKV